MVFERIRRRLRGAGGAEGGGVAVLTALALPPLLVMALGAVQISAVYSDKQKMQDVADAAALFGAQQLAFTKEGAAERTIAMARAQLVDVAASSASMVIDAKQGDDWTLKVTIDTNRPSFFVNLFPRGGFNIHAEATAQSSNKIPLCVLVFGDANGDTLKVKDQARVTAGECLVHANQKIEVQGSALIQAFATQTAKTATGPIIPAALTGAAEIEDPFTKVDLSFPLLCSVLKVLPDMPILLNTTLPPGLHCGNFRVMNGAVLTLSPGDHYFSGDLRIEDSSKLVGEDVALVFDGNTKFDFKDNAEVSLGGRRSGRLAGFVIAANRTNSKDFTIASDHVSKLLGTVYVPNGKLVVDGKSPVAQSSAWTVITARAIEMRQNPQLVINANYSTSNVPVPSGVGPTRADAKLVR